MMHALAIRSAFSIPLKSVERLMFIWLFIKHVNYFKSSYARWERCCRTWEVSYHMENWRIPSILVMLLNISFLENTKCSAFLKEITAQRHENIFMKLLLRISGPALMKRRKSSITVAVTTSTRIIFVGNCRWIKWKIRYHPCCSLKP